MNEKDTITIKGFDITFTAEDKTITIKGHTYMHLIHELACDMFKAENVSINEEETLITCINRDRIHHLMLANRISLLGDDDNYV